MPRKPKAEKQVRGFVVDGKDVRVSFFPPKGRERSWQVYWTAFGSVGRQSNLAEVSAKRLKDRLIHRPRQRSRRFHRFHILREFPSLIKLSVTRLVTPTVAGAFPIGRSGKDVTAPKT